MHGGRGGRHPTLRVDQPLERLLAQHPPVDHPDRADRDDLVAAGRVEAGGLGVEDRVREVVEVAVVPLQGLLRPVEEVRSRRTPVGWRASRPGRAAAGCRLGAPVSGSSSRRSGAASGRSAAPDLAAVPGDDVADARAAPPASGSSSQPWNRPAGPAVRPSSPRAGRGRRPASRPATARRHRPRRAADRPDAPGPGRAHGCPPAPTARRPRSAARTPRPCPRARRSRTRPPAGRHRSCRSAASRRRDGRADSATQRFDPPAQLSGLLAHDAEELRGAPRRHVGVVQDASRPRPGCCRGTARVPSVRSRSRSSRRLLRVHPVGEVLQQQHEAGDAAVAAHGPAPLAPAAAARRARRWPRATRWRNRARCGPGRARAGLGRRCRTPSGPGRAAASSPSSDRAAAL